MCACLPAWLSLLMLSIPFRVMRIYIHIYIQTADSARAGPDQGISVCSVEPTQLMLCRARIARQTHFSPRSLDDEKRVYIECRDESPSEGNRLYIRIKPLLSFYSVEKSHFRLQINMSSLCLSMRRCGSYIETTRQTFFGVLSFLL